MSGEIESEGFLAWSNSTSQKDHPMEALASGAESVDFNITEVENATSTVHSNLTLSLVQGKRVPL